MGHPCEGAAAGASGFAVPSPPLVPAWCPKVMVTRQELKTAAIPRFGKSVHPALLHVWFCCSWGIKNMAPIGSCVFSRRTAVLLASLPSIQDLMCSHIERLPECIFLVACYWP